MNKGARLPLGTGLCPGLDERGAVPAPGDLTLDEQGATPTPGGVGN